MFTSKIHRTSVMSCGGNDVVIWRQKFGHAARRLDDLALPTDVLVTSLTSFRKLQIADGRQKKSSRVPRTRRGNRFHFRLVKATFSSLLFYALIAVVVLTAVIIRSCDHVRLLSYWWNISTEDVLSEPCLITSDWPVIEALRPPVDCKTLCMNVSAIDHVAWNDLNADQFELRYAYSGRPLLVTGATVNWTALQTFSFRYFRSLYSNSSVKSSRVSKTGSSDDQTCQFFTWGSSEFNNLDEVFRMDPKRAELKEGFKPWYIGWSNCDSSVANILRSHYSRPSFLPVASEASNVDWIFMGSPGYGAPLHVDDVGLPSWQAQITGSKLWTIEPPPECYLQCPVNRHHIMVNAGDIIVLDTNRWFHSTVVLGSQISITIGSEFD